MKFIIVFLGLLLLFNIAKPSFDSEVFKNKSFFDFLRWQFTSSPGFWPNDIKIKPLSSLPEMHSSFQVIYINHSSFLIRLNDMNILIDPIYSDFASPVNFGPKRVHKPFLPYDLLPKIDFVLISHNHYDHLDLPTLRRLYNDFNPHFLVGLNTSKYLRKKIDSNIVSTDMNHADEFRYKGVSIFFENAIHWSKRSLFDTNTMLWGSFVIKTREKLIYHAGDTAYGNHFVNLHKKFGDFDFAMLPIGDYKPEWFMLKSHMNPNQAFKAMRDLNAVSGFAMHYGTFPLADNSFEDPLLDFKKAKDLNPDLNMLLPTEINFLDL